MTRLPIRCSMLLCALLLAGPAMAGPTSPLYITGYRTPGSLDKSELIVVQGDKVLWDLPVATGTQEFAIAVGSTVRTLGIRPGNTGSEYQLDYPLPTGVRYPYPSTVQMDLPDGTTNGSANFAIGYFDGTVYRFTTQWTDPQPLFSAQCCWGGITYDNPSKSVWLVGSDGPALSRIENRALDGSLLSSFSTGDSFQRFALAMDPADHTLWVSRMAPGSAAWTTPPVLEQYSTAGALLSEQAYPQLTGRVLLGAEFSQPVPEPERVALMLAGLGALAWVVRRRCAQGR